jgi:outer membrane protein TolC
MRWRSVLAGLALILTVTAGCSHPVYLDKCVMDGCMNGLNLPPNAVCDPHLGVTPAASAFWPTPADVDSPERPQRFMSLAEAISIALEQGNVGDPGLSGANNDLTLIPTAPTGIAGVGVNQSIRAFALDPAIAASLMEQALSKFDAVWTSSMTWNTTDRPVGTPLDTFQAGNAINAITTQQAQLQTGILKPLPTGGVAGITFTTPYQFTNLPSRVNPSYQPDLQFQFEQPLLQGFGVEINQLRAQHPGSVLTPGVFQQPQINDGILISRLRFDSSRADFERQVDLMVANVEIAYWNLYGAYWSLYAQEAALRQSFETWKINKAKLDSGKATTADVAQARGQYELFRGNRLDALRNVLETERQLRALLNMPGEDGFRIVPADEPTLAPYKPDWTTALNETLALRPELVQARNDLKIQQLNVINQQNTLLPDLRFFATYDINGIGTRLDGASPDNAFRSLSSDHFNNWEVGLRMNWPIGFRLANSNVRIARLNMQRSYIHLRELERRAGSILELEYRELQAFHDQISIQRAQREAYGLQLRTLFNREAAGQIGAGTDVLLEAQRFWATALQAEYQAIVNYNNTLVRFEHAKGTVLQHNNIIINEGGLPECARERAVEHERQRSKALVLCERARPIFQPCLPGGETGPGFMGTGSGAPALPSLNLEKPPPLPKDLPEGVPPPKENKDIKPASAVSDKDLPATLGSVVPAKTPTTLPLALPAIKSDKSDLGLPPVPTPLPSTDGWSPKP